MKINLWYSKSMQQWRWTLVEEWRNGVTKTEQHSGQQPMLRDAMEDVANTVEYMLECKDKGEQLSGRASRLHRGGRGFDPLFSHINKCGKTSVKEGTHYTERWITYGLGVAPVERSWRDTQLRRFLVVAQT